MGGSRIYLVRKKLHSKSSLLHITYLGSLLKQYFKTWDGLGTYSYQFQIPIQKYFTSEYSSEQSKLIIHSKEFRKNTKKLRLLWPWQKCKYIHSEARDFASIFFLEKILYSLASISFIFVDHQEAQYVQKSEKSASIWIYTRQFLTTFSAILYCTIFQNLEHCDPPNFPRDPIIV